PPARAAPAGGSHERARRTTRPGRGVGRGVRPPVAAGRAAEPVRVHGPPSRLGRGNPRPVPGPGGDGAVRVGGRPGRRPRAPDRTPAPRAAGAPPAGRTSGIARRLLSGEFTAAQPPATPRPESARGALADSAPLEDSGRGVASSSSSDLAAQPEARY